MKFKLKLFKILNVIIVIIWVFWLILIGRFIVEIKIMYPLKYSEYVIQNENAYGIPAELILSVINVESHFNAKAQSNKGACGLMQIMPNTQKFIAEKLNITEYDIFDEEINIKFGSYYLNYLNNKFESLILVLCAYNAGEGNVRQWLNSSEYSPDGTTLTTIPFKETREYVDKVIKGYENYIKYHKQNFKILRKNFNKTNN